MNRNKGFTLIEILSVLFLMGVVASILLAGGLNQRSDENARADVLVSHLRYAQARAMNSDVSWGIQFNGSTYSLISDVGGSDSVCVLPGEKTTAIDFSSPVTGIVAFDTWGKPSGLSIISVGERIITITPDTGFIP